ncbi:MAG: hypothetical protein ACRDQU_12440 [Pseudonocardiaceae bacterium]
MIDDRDNNIVAAGALLAVVQTSNLDPQIVMEDGHATNAITVRFGCLRSRYRLTVERVVADDAAGGEPVFSQERP